MKTQLLFLFFLIGLSKAEDYALTMKAKDLSFNQYCTFFNAIKDSKTQFKFFIHLEKPIIGYSGYGINSFYVTNKDNSKTMEASCTFQSRDTQVVCTLNEQLIGEDREAFYFRSPKGSSADFICFEENDTEQKNPKKCHLDGFKFDKEVLYSENAYVLSDDILREQSVDLSKDGANFMVEFLNVVEDDNLPSVFVGSEEVDCKVPEGTLMTYILCYPNPKDYNIGAQSKFFPLSVLNACNNVELPGITIELYDSVEEEKAIQKGELIRKEIQNKSKYIKLSQVLLGILAMIML